MVAFVASVSDPLSGLPTSISIPTPSPDGRALALWASIGGKFLGLIYENLPLLLLALGIWLTIMFWSKLMALFRYGRGTGEEPSGQTYLKM